MTLRRWARDPPRRRDPAATVELGGFRLWWKRRPENTAPAAEATQDGPRLLVWRSGRGDRPWIWVIRSPDGRWLDGSVVATQDTAVREGLAALDRLDRRGD